MNKIREQMPCYGWRWRHVRGPGRPMKPRMIKGLPEVGRFIPASSDGTPIPNGNEPIIMTPDEFEALRLIDYEGLLQEEAALRMGVSRGTVWRCLDSARRKVAAMLVEGRGLLITHEETHLQQNISKLSKGSSEG
ncbi:MAG: DUF134 domain-containing protein [Nitrososphaerales archaeon]